MIGGLLAAVIFKQVWRRAAPGEKPNPKSHWNRVFRQQPGWPISSTSVPARRGNETKAAFRTTDSLFVAVIGVLIASFLVSTTGAHGAYLRTDRAWLYVVILSMGAPPRRDAIVSSCR